PAMIQRGYSPGFAGAVASTGGTIGIMIPPSTPMIFYGVAGNVSITDMFMAGILPGLLVSGALIAVSWWLSRQSGYGGTGERLSAARFMRALKGATLALLAPVIILGGIYGGVFTPTEASVVAVAYALVVGGLVYRELSWDDIYRALLHAVVVCGTVTIIVGLAGGFGRVLTTYQIPQAIGAGLLEITDSWIVLLILIGLTLIVIGTFMETLATIIILTPILLPVVTQVGVDPIHFGILLIITSEISFLTPPLGANLFVAMRISGASLEQVTMAVLPFIAALIVMTGLLIVLPQISTFVPTLLR
ncbi:MAG: TRAP transporter large permease, partial [Kiloniellales bacterium]|nr:TRAP transporter large permease [Kiloniellales bacterium]